MRKPFQATGLVRRRLAPHRTPRIAWCVLLALSSSGAQSDLVSGSNVIKETAFPGAQRSHVLRAGIRMSSIAAEEAASPSQTKVNQATCANAKNALDQLSSTLAKLELQKTQCRPVRLEPGESNPCVTAATEAINEWHGAHDAQVKVLESTAAQCQASLPPPPPPAPINRGNLNISGILTNLNGNARTGDYFEKQLGPATVHAGAPRTFGKIKAWPVNGQIYAQPLYARGVKLADGKTHNVVYAATQENFVYAFDADNFSQLWSVSLGAPVPAQEVDSRNNIRPFVGITSTPVISPQEGAIYVVAKTKENGQYAYSLHGLDLGTGREIPSSPVVIGAAVRGNGTGNIGGVINFTPRIQLNRPGLLLANDTIYVAFGSHADSDDYHGWVFGYNAHTFSQVGVFITTPSGEEGVSGRPDGALRRIRQATFI